MATLNAGLVRRTARALYQELLITLAGCACWSQLFEDQRSSSPGVGSHPFLLLAMVNLRVINLAVRFFLELAALAAVAYWAARLDASRGVRILLAILAPMIVAVFWGLFVSPKARFSTGHAGQVWLGLIVFLAASAALFARGQFALGVAFACTAVVSSVLLHVLPR